VGCRQPVPPPAVRQALAPRLAEGRPPKQARRPPHSCASRCRRRVRHRDRRTLSLPARRSEHRARRLQSTRPPRCVRCGGAGRPPASVRGQLLTQPTATAASNLVQRSEPVRAASMLPMCARARRSRCGHHPSGPASRRCPTERACVIGAALGQRGVDIHLAHVVDDHRHAQYFAVAQDAMEERGVTRPERLEESGDGQARWHGRFAAR